MAMGLLVVAIGVLSLSTFFAAGVWTLRRSPTYRDLGTRGPAVHALFACVFALAACMLELLVFDVLGALDDRWVPVVLVFENKKKTSKQGSNLYI
jgi:hypothetical protein